MLFGGGAGGGIRINDESLTRESSIIQVRLRGTSESLRRASLSERSPESAETMRKLETPQRARTPHASSMHPVHLGFPKMQSCTGSSTGVWRQRWKFESGVVTDSGG